MDSTYLGLATLCFAAGFIYAVVTLRRGAYRNSAWNLLAIGLGLVFQTLFLYERGLIHGRCPVTSLVEILVFVSWSMVIIYLLIGRTYRLSLMGVFTSPLVFVSCALAILSGFDREAAAAAALAKGPADRWTEMHIGVSLLAYGAFGMAFVAALMYLLQERQVRKASLGQLFYNLPPMQNLSVAVFRLLLVGSVLLTAGIASAHAIGETADPHPIWPLYVMWLVYVGLCAWSKLRGMQPRHLALGSIFAFLISLTTLWIVSSTY